jgi:DNA-binding NtrC family response regulator
MKVTTVPCLDAAREKLNSHKFDLVLWRASAYSLSELSDLRNMLTSLAPKGARTKVVILTSGEEPLGFRPPCSNLHFEKEPADEQEWQRLVERFLSCQSRRIGRPLAETLTDVPIEFEGMIIVGLPMLAVMRRAWEAANVDVPVLITGETGTGKDLLAAGIHKRSQRKDKPYVAINTGAMAPELVASELFGHERGAYTGAQDAHPGIFEQAHGGTVFLDEIATMDAKIQISLLRVLEEKSFRRVGGVKTISADVRIIAAANEDLDKSVAVKRFREDLFYRLNVFHIAVPALRDRPGAVTVLTDHFVAAFAKLYDKEIERVAPETYRLLRHYPWPGNVRELKNVIQTAVLMAEGHELTPDLIPQRIRDASIGGNGRNESTCTFTVGVSLGAVEKELIRLTLASARGNKKGAAAILGISRRALYNKIKRHRLS